MGLDDICNLVVKSCSDSLAPILTELKNNSFKTGIFPEDLKRAQVFPLYKGDSKADLNNYLLISLLIVFSNFLKDHVKSHLSVPRTFPASLFKTIWIYEKAFND